jgi:hypothetical protein
MTLNTFRRAVVAYVVYAAIHVIFDSTLAGAQPADAMDLRQAVVHGSPASVAGWDRTVTIDGLKFDARDGLSFRASVPGSWNSHVPGWGDPSAGDRCVERPGFDNGCVLYTVWAVADIGGQLHAAGYIQMWKDRASTGAPLPSDWVNWGGDVRGIFGPELLNYRPKAGDRMGFFITAGNARLVGDSPRHERSNVVAVALPAGDSGEFEFGGAPQTDNKQVVEDAKRDLLAAGADLSGACGAFRITNLVAWRLRPAYGFLVKRGGNRAIVAADGSCKNGDNPGDGFATDYIIERATGFGFDILKDGGDANGPQWAGPETDAEMVARNRANFAEPFEWKFSGGPGPVDPPADAGLKARVEKLEADLAALAHEAETTDAELHGAIGQIVGKVNELIEGLNALRAVVDSLAADVTALKAKPIPVSCTAAIRTGAFNIPISCRLGQ